MPQTTLYRPYLKFCRESSRLLNAIQSLPTSSPLEPIHRCGGEMAVIRLYDAWARFCRELVLLSATGRPLTAKGSRIPCCASARTRTDALSILTNGGKQFEPDWAKSKKCLDAAQRLSIFNFRTVSAAIGAQSPIEEIRVIRNFFAHRSKRTADDIRKHPFSISPQTLRIEHLVGVIVPPAITRMESWIVDLRHLALASIQ